MMLTANLVGFVIGVDGMKYMIEQILGSLAGESLHALTIVYGTNGTCRGTIPLCCLRLHLCCYSGHVRIQVSRSFLRRIVSAELNMFIQGGRDAERHLPKMLATLFIRHFDRSCSDISIISSFPPSAYLLFPLLSHVRARCL